MAIDVVFKVASPRLHRDLTPDELDHGEYSPHAALQAIHNEARLYSSELHLLQGEIVPRYFGLYQSDDHFVMVLEDVGHEAFTTDLASLNASCQ